MPDIRRVPCLTACRAGGCAKLRTGCASNVARTKPLVGGCVRGERHRRSRCALAEGKRMLPCATDRFGRDGYACVDASAVSKCGEMLRACPVCGRIHNVSHECKTKRMPRTSAADRFRNTKEWHDARDAARERDTNMCVVCRSEGLINVDDLSVHHIVPLEEDYELRAELDNLATVCGEHHRKAERGDISRDFLRDLIRRHLG